MKKQLLLALPLGLFGASGLPYFVNDVHGYLPKNQGDIGIEVLKMNDMVDILNIKESEFGGNLKETSIGDMNGVSIFGRYKLKDDLMGSGRYQKATVSYGAGELNNQKMELFARHNILSKNFALDIGMVQNKGDAIVNKDIDMINSMITRFVGSGGSIVCSSFGCDINYKDSTGDEQTLGATIEPYISTNNLKDNTVYLRAIKSISDEISTVDTYISYGYTKINTFLDSSIHYEPNTTLQNELRNKGIAPYKNLDRTEQKITLGINYSAFVGKWAMDALYEYDYFLRDSELGYINHNHKIDINIGYKIFPNIRFFVGGKIMSNQFNGEIPYLYNKYTQTSFDHKYGWAKTGLVYSF